MLQIADHRVSVFDIVKLLLQQCSSLLHCPQLLAGYLKLVGEKLIDVSKVELLSLQVLSQSGILNE